jgi:predicted  nucleic acid-binding Zn-ribbon protein
MTNNQLQQEIEKLSKRVDKQEEEIKELKSKLDIAQNNIIQNRDDIAEQVHKCKDIHRTFGY